MHRGCNFDLRCHALAHNRSKWQKLNGIQVFQGFQHYGYGLVIMKQLPDTCLL